MCADGQPVLETQIWFVDVFRLWVMPYIQVGAKSLSRSTQPFSQLLPLTQIVPDLNSCPQTTFAVNHSCTHLLSISGAYKMRVRRTHRFNSAENCFQTAILQDQFPNFGLSYDRIVQQAVSFILCCTKYFIFVEYKIRSFWLYEMVGLSCLHNHRGNGQWDWCLRNLMEVTCFPPFTKQ